MMGPKPIGGWTGSSLQSAMDSPKLTGPEQETVATAADLFAPPGQAFEWALLEHQGLRWQLATELEAARLLTYRAADIVAGGGDVAAALSARYGSPRP